MEVKFIFTLGIIFLLISSMIFAIDIESEIKINRRLIREKEYDALIMGLKKTLKNKDINDAAKIYESATITLLQQYDYEKALEVIEFFINKYPESNESAFFYNEKGFYLKRSFKYKEAIKPLEKYIELAKYNFSKRFGKRLVSEIYFIYNEYEKAERYLNWILSDTDLPSDYVPAAIQLSEVYFARGKMEEAYKLIQEGLELYGKDNEDMKKYYLQYKVKLAQYYFLQKDWSNFNKVNQMPFFWNHYSTNLVYQLNKMYKYRDDEDIIKAYYHFSLSQYDKTLQTLKHCVAEKEDKKFIVKTMEGVSYFWLGNREKAKDVLQSTVDKDNIFLDQSAFYLALMIFDEGNYQKAQEYLNVFDDASKYSTLKKDAETLYYRIKNRIDKINFRY